MSDCGRSIIAIDADVSKTYVEFGLGIAILPAMAFGRKRDKTLRALDASHPFEPNTIHVGIRRNHYRRGGRIPRWVKSHTFCGGAIPVRKRSSATGVSCTVRIGTTPAQIGSA